MTEYKFRIGQLVYFHPKGRGGRRSMPQLDRIRSYSDCRFANLTRKQTWLQPYGVAERLFEATGLGMRVIVAPAPI